MTTSSLDRDVCRVVTARLRAWSCGQTETGSSLDGEEVHRLGARVNQTKMQAAMEMTDMRCTCCAQVTNEGYMYLYTLWLGPIRLVAGDHCCCGLPMLVAPVTGVPVSAWVPIFGSRSPSAHLLMCFGICRRARDFTGGPLSLTVKLTNHGHQATPNDGTLATL